MTPFDVEEPLLATYDEKSQKSGNGANNGHNDPTQTPIYGISYATVKRLSLTQMKNAVRVFDLWSDQIWPMDTKPINSTYRIMEPIDWAETRIPDVCEDKCQANEIYNTTHHTRMPFAPFASFSSAAAGSSSSSSGASYAIGLLGTKKEDRVRNKWEDGVESDPLNGSPEIVRNFEGLRDEIEPYKLRLPVELLRNVAELGGSASPCEPLSIAELVPIRRRRSLRLCGSIGATKGGWWGDTVMNWDSMLMLCSESTSVSW
jgi:hypothetical protein